VESFKFKWPDAGIVPGALGSQNMTGCRTTALKKCVERMKRSWADWISSLHHSGYVIQKIVLKKS
jgi:hypothetical protein